MNDMNVNWWFVGQAIGAMAIGWKLYRKERGNGKRDHNSIVMSEETGGAKHISEEALERLKKKMDTSFHEQYCRANTAELVNTLTEKIDEKMENRINATEERLLMEIRRINGKTG